MRLKIVGAAAGGGFPQWNCNYYLSRAARHGDPHVVSRTQSSLAASANGKDWMLFNASPDIRTQIANTLELQPDPHGPMRSSPIAAVVLTNADVDHIAGLLSLREQQPFVIYATQRVLDVLDANSIFNVIDRDRVERRVLPLNQSLALSSIDHHSLGITIEAFPVPGKIALFLEDQTLSSEGYGSKEGDTIGIKITSEIAGQSAFYIPGCAKVDSVLATRLRNASVLMFDGTVFTDDEMPKAGVGLKTGKRMGHIAISGAEGSIEALRNLGIKRRIFLHINNTNPILDDRSPEAVFVREMGWEIAFDGMELSYE